MIGVLARDEIDHLARDRIGREAHRRRQETRPLRSEAVAIVVVVVPLPGRRLGALHQHAMALAQVAVEPFQPQLAPTLGPGRELLRRGVEMPILAHLDRHAGLGTGRADRGIDATVSGQDHHHAFRPPGRQIRRQRVSKSNGVMRPMGAITHVPAATAQRFREVPHRREKQRDPRPVRPDLRRLLAHLGHPHRIPPRIEPVERRRRGVELVAEDEDQVAQGRVHAAMMAASVSRPRPCRQSCPSLLDCLGEPARLA
jgi:hypothetical protein